jgi:lipopolysaccharide/colanic/teichoic acid biosynthesis glycosyltransferase
MSDRGRKRVSVAATMVTPGGAAVNSRGAGRARQHDNQLSHVAKRLFDSLGSACGLLVLAPALLIMGLIIRLESPGPALFRQQRLGKDGLPFTFYKFRTMFDGNDPSIHKKYVRKLITSGSEELKGDTGSFKIEDDPRVTRIGYFLRRWSIDELPQLLNVLMGDMSIVGPLPPLQYEVELYSEHARRRLECLPGITGLWQVSGRCETTFEEMVELDIEYVDNWSLALDASILLRTIPVVLGRRGAW